MDGEQYINSITLEYLLNPNSEANLHNISPHRVYRFHYSRTVLAFCCTGPLLFSEPNRMTGVTRYVVLWCPDFPLSRRFETAIRRPAGQK